MAMENHLFQQANHLFQCAISSMWSIAGLNIINSTLIISLGLQNMDGLTMLNPQKLLVFNGLA